MICVMKTCAEQKYQHSFLIPRALFLGVGLAFVACCVAGRRSSESHQLGRVKRFHQLISPENLFYPTASQVKQLALTRSRKSCINVIIGGSSILNGSGQQAHELWSDNLAELLGPDYRVINLGFRGATTGEFGVLAAEMIMNRRDVILITDISPNGGKWSPDGWRYRYFFWDAWYKKLIDRKNSQRNAALAELPALRKSDEAFAEIRAGAWMDSKLYFNDLWNSVAYNHGNAVWNPLCRSDSFKPRSQMNDNEPKPLSRELRRADPGYEDTLKRTASRVVEIIEDSRPQLDSRTMRDEILRTFEACLPNEKLRQRTIVVVNSFAPAVVERLTQEQRDDLAALSKLTEEAVHASGMPCLQQAGLFTDDEHADTVHLNASGGAKLAMEVAPLVRAVAAKLGYLQTKVIPEGGGQ